MHEYPVDVEVVTIEVVIHVLVFENKCLRLDSTQWYRASLESSGVSRLYMSANLHLFSCQFWRSIH